MPSPAQIMFMSSLINNVPESSPLTLIFVLYETKSFLLKQINFDGAICRVSVHFLKLQIEPI